MAARGDCTRRQVGAVLVDQGHRIISTGYNGTLPGNKGCLAGGCPRGRHYKSYQGNGPDEAEWYCACNSRWPCPDSVEPGSSYDTGRGACISLHAEQNCLLYAFRSVEGMTMYITDEPCGGCLKLLRGARLHSVITPTGETACGLPLKHDDLPAPGGPHRADLDPR